MPWTPESCCEPDSFDEFNRVAIAEDGKLSLNPDKTEASGHVAVMVEIIVAGGHEAASILRMAEKALAGCGFRLDKEYAPVPLTPSPQQLMLLEGGRKELHLVRGEVSQLQLKDLEKLEAVVKVWPETRIEPFQGF